VSPVPLCYTYW